jgi:hypothetical protein
MGEHTPSHRTRPHDSVGATRDRPTPLSAASAGLDPLVDLNGLAGNRAVADLVASSWHQPGRVTDDGGPDARGSSRPASIRALTASAAVLQRQPKTRPAPAGAAGKAGESGGSGASELAGAEAWLMYVALRGNTTRPSDRPPEKYAATLNALQSAIGGPGPDEPSRLVVNKGSFDAGRAALARLRADHDRLTPKASAAAYQLADLAIERGQANFGKGPDSFEGGATQLDQGQLLLSIRSAADDELREAREAGYQIPKDLAALPSEAQAQYDNAAAGWPHRAPSTTQLTTPTDEADLVEFTRHATETINDMRERRIADIARQRRAEAEALEEAADRQLAELRQVIADRRRAAFAAGDEDVLHKIHEALGEVTGAVGDVKAAAAIITKRVDQLNAAAKVVTKAGTALINLPAVPKAITDVTGWLDKAHSKLGDALKLLDLLGPAKTQLDDGIRYLKGVDLTLEHFGGSNANPFIKVYVTAYLGPGIKNCIAQLGKIAEIQGRSNRSQLEQGQIIDVKWGFELGGAAAESIYLYLVQVYKVGALAPVPDDVFAFLDTHRGDLEAAVVPEGTKDPMPKSQRSLGAWIARHRTEVWQSFYGSTREPRAG